MDSKMSISFKIKVSKLANQFFFVSNLSEWHFSCRRKYNEVWLNNAGKLTAEEKQALQSFKTILSRYDFTYKNNKSQYLGRFFYEYDDKKAWEELGKFVNEKEFRDIQQGFAIFKPRFEVMWKRIRRNHRRISVLKNYLGRKENRLLFEDVVRTFGTLKRNKTITIILIFSPLGPKETAAGSATINTPYVILELPDLKHNTWQFAYSIGVLAHEVSHLLFRENGGMKIIKQAVRILKLPKEVASMPARGTISLLDELIVESFLPLGYIGQKYLWQFLSPLLFYNIRKAHSLFEKSNKEAKIDYNQLKYYILWRLFPMAASYEHKKKRVDRHYVLEAGRLLKQIIQNKSRQIRSAC
jgi:hypothetical protein